MTAADTYMADRCKNGSGCMLFEKTENGAKMTGASVMGALMFGQKVEHQNGTFDFTISAKVKSNGPFTLSLAIPGSYVDSETFPASDDFMEISATFPSFNVNSGLVIVSIRSKQDSALTVECAWIKLEHGLVATPWQPKTYAEELLECQRYYVNFNAPPEFYWQCVTAILPSGVVNENEVIGASTCFPVKMRVLPTITLYGYINKAANSVTVDGKDIAEVQAQRNTLGIVSLVSTENTLPTNKPIFFGYTASADL